jgi:glycosyltransferase involved in cell wall biosynthesis
MKVSALIPTYNRLKHVLRAIDSVLAQTVPVDEIIVVDDGSTDGSAEAIRSRYGSHVKVFSQENAGVSVARQRAVAEARGQWIAFLDSDDEWLPGRNHALLEAASALPQSVGWIVGDTQLVTDQGEDVTLFKRSGIAIDQSHAIFEKPLLLQYPHFLCMLQSSFIRRSALIELRTFRQKFRNGEDLLAAAEVASRYAFAAIPVVVTKWYLTSDLSESSLERLGFQSEDRCRARISSYALAARFAGRDPWTTFYEAAVRELCKLRAEKGLPIRGLAWEQFKFRVSLNSLAFFCATMLGYSFIRAGVTAKSKLRSVVNQDGADSHTLR